MQYTNLKLEDICEFERVVSSFCTEYGYDRLYLEHAGVAAGYWRSYERSVWGRGSN